MHASLLSGVEYSYLAQETSCARKHVAVACLDQRLRSSTQWGPGY